MTSHGDVTKNNAPKTNKPPYYEIKATGRFVDKDVIAQMLRGLHFDFKASGKTLEHVILSFEKQNKCSPSKSVGSSNICLLYTSPSPRDATLSRMPSSA